MGSADYTTPVLTTLAFIIPFTIIGLINAIATGNIGLMAFLVIVILVEAYAIFQKFIYHGFLKYASDDTYVIYHYDDYGRRDMDAYASDGTIERIRSEKTLKVLQAEYGKAEDLKLGYHWWKVPYRNNGGGYFIIGSDLPPNSLSPSIKGRAPLDGFSARTRLHDITSDKMSSIIKAWVEVPITNTGRLKSLLGFHAPIQGKRVVKKTIPIYRHAYSDWAHLLAKAQRHGIEPHFSSRAEAIEVLQGVGEEAIAIDAKPYELDRRVDEALIIQMSKTSDRLVKGLEENDPGVVYGTDQPQTPQPATTEEGGTNWTKIAAIALIVIVAGAALVANLPAIMAYANNIQSKQTTTPTELGPGEHYIVFYANGIANSIDWTANVGGTNGTHHNAANNYLAFIVHNGVWTFTVYPPKGYAAQPPAGKVTVNGTDISQVIMFVLITQHTTSSTTSTTKGTP